jgi:uncharacterized membrane protein YdjX (TVP38/TMEM64 family)
MIRLFAEMSKIAGRNEHSRSRMPSSTVKAKVESQFWQVPIAALLEHLNSRIFAGTSLMPYRTFALFAYTGGFLWTITLVSLGYFLGEKWHHVYMYSHRFIIPLVLLSISVLSIGIYWKKVKVRRNKDIK